VSNTLTEPILVVEPAQTGPESGPRKPRWRSWVKGLVFAAVAVFVADAGISLLIQHTSLKRRLTSRLSAAFGREVEVGSYSFSLWSGPKLEANSVVVAEDPRFGNEYFLRAESLSVRISWRSLLTGHLDLGTVSLSQPSLNLVRNADGDWNLAEWLPRPPNVPNPPSRALPQPSLVASVRFHKIEVDEGRVNFKRGDEKLPFAFSGIKGTLETETSGRWRLDLLGMPLRAAAIVQQPGTIHLVGDVGGTSSRLRPATLQLAWTGATVPDALRLLEGRDYGVRGLLSISVVARTEGDSWAMEASAALAQLHRWNLPLRADNPSASITVKGTLESDGSHFEFTGGRIDAPASSARILGALDWSHPGVNSSSSSFRVVSAGIAATDFLAWARAFAPNIADNLSVAGFGHADLSFNGWPPRLETGIFNLPRAELAGGARRTAVRVAPIDIRYDAKGMTLAPAIFTVGAGLGSFRVDGFANPQSGEFNFHVQGATTQAREVFSATSQLGWNLARGWDIAGPMRCDFRWQGTSAPWHSEVVGTIEWGNAATGASLHAAFLNLPVEQIRGHVDLKPPITHVLLSSAQAFGAHWNGTFDHELNDGWRFTLSADELSAANLDRWLNPLWRETFLGRMLPFLSSRPAQVGASAESLRAQGRLSIDQLTFPNMPVQHFHGDLALDGRRLEFSNLGGQFEGGDLSGSLTAKFLATPAYEAALSFSSVDLRSLTETIPSLTDLFGGTATGKVWFTTRGRNRGDLVGSLQCRGSARVADASIAGIRFAESDVASGSADSADAASNASLASQPLKTSFREVSASFTCADSEIQFKDLVLRAAASAWEGQGTVDYSHNLDLELHAISSDAGESRPSRSIVSEMPAYRITGTLKSPQIQKIRPAVRSVQQH